MRADVIEPGSSEQRVTQRVADDVGIGMSLEPELEGNRDPAEHEPSPRDQTVRIEAGADP